MFQSMNRILRWTKGYHRRLYLGSLCSFLATWAAAGPVMLAAWALGLVIESAQEGTALDAKLPWLCLGGIILLILLRFVCAYWKTGSRRVSEQSERRSRDWNLVTCSNGFPWGISPRITWATFWLL